MKTIRAIHIDDRDNCATLTEAAESGDMVVFRTYGEEQIVTACGHIPIWHKMALIPVKKGGSIYKYGAVIGVATEDIEAGGHIHVFNICSPGYTLEGSEADTRCI